MRGGVFTVKERRRVADTTTEVLASVRHDLQVIARLKQGRELPEEGAAIEQAIRVVDRHWEDYVREGN